MAAAADIRTMLAPADPAGSATIPPPVVTHTDLIARAESGVAERRRVVRRRFVLPVAAGVVVLMAVPAAVVALTSAGPDLPLPDPRLIVAPLALQIQDDEPPPAADRLRELARGAGPSAGDATTGRYGFHHTQEWGTIMMAAGEHQVAFVFERRYWKLPDGSGHISTAQLGPQYPDAASQRYWAEHSDGLVLDPQGAGSFTGGDVSVEVDPNLPAVLDRAALARQLRLDRSAAEVLQAAVGVSMQYVLTAAQRAVLLDLLAAVPGIEWRGAVTDRAGRAGVAVTAFDKHNNVRQVLVLDPATGEVIAGETTWPERSKLVGYTLLLETGRRN